MRYFLDVEFNDYQGELISMALVGEDGSEFYEVVEWKQPTAPWVAVNVVPVLGKDAISWEVFQDRLRQFLRHRSAITIICDWPDDVRHFCASLIRGPGVRLSLMAPGIAFSVDFTLPSTVTLSKVPHNALEDARALARAAGWIQ